MNTNIIPGTVQITIDKFRYIGDDKVYMNVSFKIDEEDAIHFLDIGVVEYVGRPEKIRMDIDWYKSQGYELRFNNRFIQRRNTNYTRCGRF